MIFAGHKVRVVGGDLYLGKWIPAMTEGTVRGRYTSTFGNLYMVEIDGEIFHMAEAEIAEIDEEGGFVNGNTKGPLS